MNEVQMKAIQAIDDYFKSSNSVPVSRATIKREEWERAKAALISQAKSVPPIERDEEMQRDYIPLPANWEIQTKGKGSTFRLAKTDGSDIRWPILEKMLHEPLEQMAREIHAAWQAAPQPTDDRVRELMLKACQLRDEYSAAGDIDASYQVSDEYIVDEVLDEAKKEANQ